MGSGAILSLGEAEALLPIADPDARGWLQSRGLVRYLAGRPVVVWAEVQDALRRDDGAAPPQRSAPLPRVKL